MAVNPDPRFVSLITAIRNWADQAAKAEQQGTQSKWFRPEGLTSLTDVNAMLAPFSRETVNAELVAALAKEIKAGDLVAATAQIAYLAVAGRAFVNRHTSPLRGPALVVGRQRGHAAANGPINVNALEFVLSVLKEARKQ